MSWPYLPGLAAALLMGLPAPAANRVILIELCDATHSGRRIPLPLDPDHDRPAACHAVGTVVPDRRTRS